MDTDDADTPQAGIPPNAIAYNGVITPYGDGTINGDVLNAHAHPSEDYTKTVSTRADNPPLGEAFVIDDQGATIADDEGRYLVAVSTPATPPVPDAGPLSFASDSNSTFGNFTFTTSHNRPGSNNSADYDDEALPAEVRHREVLYRRLDELERLLRSRPHEHLNRNHNNPPELLEVEAPITQTQFRELTDAISQLRHEVTSASPNKQNVVAQASVFNRLGEFLKTTPGMFLGYTVAGVVGNRADAIVMNYYQNVLSIVVSVGETAMAWAHQLPHPF